MWLSRHCLRGARRPYDAAMSDEIVCPNCGTRYADRYCPHCAQPARIAVPTVRQFVAEFAEKALAIQGKLPLTLRILLTSPGQLSADYFAGRRERYLKPLNLYVAVSVLFFLLLSLVPGLSVRIGPVLEINTEAVAESRIESQTGIATIDARVARFADLSAERRQQLLRDGVVRRAPQALLLLVPLFAGLLKLLYPRRYYGEHLLFALHFHSFAFLALLPGLVPWPQPLHDALNTAVNVVLLVYLLLALRCVYRSGWPGTVARVLLIAVVYALLLALAALAVVMLSVPAA